MGVSSQTATPGNSAYEWVRADVVRAICKETGLSPQDMSDETSFQDVGVESVLSVAVVETLESTYGPLSKALLFEFSTVGKLTAHLVTVSGAIEEQAQESQSALVHAEKELTQTTPPTFSSEEGGIVPDVFQSISTPKPEVGDHTAKVVPTIIPAPSRKNTAEDDDAIAIVGMAGQFPDADSIESFWEHLLEGADNISVIPERLWDWQEFWEERAGHPGKSYSKWGGFLPDHRLFDPMFFRMSKLEAEAIDPQERVFLETVYLALEDAQSTRKKRDGKRCGLYVAIMWGSYQHYGSMDASAGASYATIANRASFALDLTGPSIPIDTMCSGSLTTLHMAAQSIRNGECEMAVAGGVNLTTHPNKYFVLSKTGFAAADGRCKPFSSDADGYVPSEGSGALVLKKLSDARKDGDKVYAILRSSAVNHGGAVNNLTMPNVDSQEELIETSFTGTDITPDQIGYVEAHAPGTSLGDPIEVRALSNVFGRQGMTAGDVAIGSVKSNIGHLESAAGVASVVKVIQQMRNRQLVPSIHAETRNPNINFDVSPFALQESLSAWTPVLNKTGVEEPLRAMINCFGAGGTNAHALLEAGQTRPDLALAGEDAPQLFLFSARTKTARHALLVRMRKALAAHDARHDSPRAQELAHAVYQAVAEASGVDRKHLEQDDSLSDLLNDPAKWQALPAALAQTSGVWPTTDELAGMKTVLELSELIQRIAIPDFVPAGERWERAYFQGLAKATQTGRDPQQERVAIVARDLEELKTILDELITGSEKASGYSASGTATPKDTVRLRGELTEGYVHELTANRRLEKLAKLWVKGLSVNWASAFPVSPLRVDLPLYPFDHEICWAPQERPDASWQTPRGVVTVAPGAVLDLKRSLSDDQLFFSLEKSDQYSEQIQTLAEMARLVLEGAALPAVAQIEQWADLTASSIPDSILIKRRADGGVVALAQCDGHPAAEMVVRSGYATHTVSAAPVSKMIEQAEASGGALGNQAQVVQGGVVSRLRLTREGDHAGLMQAVTDVARSLGEVGHEPLLLGQLCQITELPKEGWICLTSASEDQAGDAEQEAFIFNNEHQLVAHFSRVVYGLRPQVAPLRPQVRQFEEQWNLLPALPKRALERDRKLLVIAPTDADIQASDELFAVSQKQVITYQRKGISQLQENGHWVLNVDDMAACKACFQLFDDPDAVVFVSSSDPAMATVELSLIHALSREMIHRNLFRRSGFNFHVVTRGALMGDGAEAGEVRPSAIPGYLRTLRRETNGQIFLADFDPSSALATLPKDQAMAFWRQAGEPKATEIAVRGNSVYGPTVEEVPHGSIPSAAFSHNGVYVLFGGNGTIGQRFSLELATQYGARLVWVSRSDLTEEASAVADRIRAAGGELTHVKADVSDAAAVQETLSQVETQYGRIDGVLNLTMVRDIRRIADLPEEMMPELIKSKMEGTDNIIAACASVQPGFVLLFSSIDVFVGSVGWSAYTAACSYQVSASWKARQSSLPVHVINWGFWEGIDDDIAANLAEKGIGLLTVTDGLSATACALQSGNTAPVFTVASDEMLSRVGFKLLPKETANTAQSQSVPAPQQEAAVSIAPVFEPKAAPAPVPAQNQVQPVVVTAPVRAEPQGVEEQAGQMLGSLRNLFADILKLDPDALDPEADLLNYGVDSLIVVNIQTALEEQVGAIPTGVLLENSTLVQIAQAIARDHPEAARALLPDQPQVSTAAVAVEPAVAPQPVAQLQAPSPIRVLHQVPANDIEAFLHSYAESYDAKTLENESSEAARFVPTDDGSLQHAMVKTESGEVEVFSVGNGGTPIVMFSAVALTVPTWTPLLTSSLTQSHQLIVVHQPGYGLSAPVSECNNQRVAAITRKTLHQIGVTGPVHVFGSCLGSVPAMHFAADFPQDTASLTLFGAFHDASDLNAGDPSTMSSQEFAELAQTAVATLERDFDMVAKAEASASENSSEERDRAVAYVNACRALLMGSQKVNFLVALRYLNEMMSLSMMPVLERISCRCLCVVGNRDQIIEPRHSTEIASALKEAELVEIDRSGHFPYLTHPHDVLPVLRTFLDRTQASTSTESAQTLVSAHD
ncbi:Polyketide synthase PksL [Pseudovibrio axinellae]|uniref:Polyketide synthase PksL n=1 Tax=Pseudovibrio axinellae TaxID=989403 RepID=A0A161V0C5_9HYPH|nr:SDR family NAD(P)-dependent oxidoreductase [Pseudovibrio axinellae]KZL09094.1 Polyketide synthase PksL [Pseudovibrio axinellae]SER75135.1 Alpha/beta hydrolase family protein [Pseudovibrio axinellae]